MNTPKGRVLALSRESYEYVTALLTAWHDFLKEKTVNEITGSPVYTHQRLRSAMVSISTYLPSLFTYEDVDGMPNTNNMIEGTFTDMKKTLRNHPGMIEDNRKRMVNGFFLAYAKFHNTKGDNQ